MTARIIRRGLGRHNWRQEMWRIALAVITLLVAWLILSSVAAAPPPTGDGIKRSRAALPGAGSLPDFDPNKFLETMLGKAAGDRNRADLLDKVEVSWKEVVVC